MYIFMKVLFKTNLFVWFSNFQTQQLKSYSSFIFPMFNSSLVQNDLNYQHGGSIGVYVNLVSFSDSIDIPKAPFGSLDLIHSNKL
jgi:hypothetical protein